MILFTILAIILITLVVFSVLIIGITGASFIIVFADVIVCAAIIWWIMKHILDKKNK